MADVMAATEIGTWLADNRSEMDRAEALWLERAVRFYQLHASQHRSPSSNREARRVSRRPKLDGTTTIQITLEDSEAEELWRIIRAFAEQHRRADESARADCATGPVDRSTDADGESTDVVHDGYFVDGDPNGVLIFHRPDGTVIGRTTPAGVRLRIMA